MLTMAKIKAGATPNPTIEIVKICPPLAENR